MSLAVGPLVNSGVTGPLRLLLNLDGELITSASPDTGYLHRGIEKIAERMPWVGFLPYVDRLDYVSPMHSSLAYALAVERLASIDVSERASSIRVAVCELSRISSHLLNLGQLSRAVGFNTLLMYTLRDREKINDLFEMLCGARVTFAYIRIGGVAYDVTEGFIERTYDFINYFQHKLQEYVTLFSENAIFTGRLMGIGQISKSTALDCGLTGPNLRASGCPLDLRKSVPYSNYHRFDFEVPQTKTKEGSGDCFDRQNIRLQEISQSIAIVKQVLDRLPGGDCLVSLPRVFKVPAGEAYVAIESPRGVFGAYVSSKGEKFADRVHFRTPSFAALNLFPGFLKNVSLNNLPIIMASLDLVASEIDR